MSHPLEVVCWVLGDEPKSAFVVPIDKSMYVDSLKEAIKARQPVFKDIAASDLHLWKVSIYHCQLCTYTEARCGGVDL